jgi:uncharacterized protein (DUF2236 family)
MMWRIGRCHFVGGLGSGRALLLQIAHPWVTQGVDDHSRTREDPIGRARRTFTNVLSITFGSLEQALTAARRVHARHERVRGAMSYDAGAFGSGSQYAANEMNALLWVHATLWETAMRMYELLIEPVSAADKERYYQESKLFAYLFGIDDAHLPVDWSAFIAYNERMWTSDQLFVTPAARELVRFLFKPLAPGLGSVMRWMEAVTAVTLPLRLANDFGLAVTPEVQERADRGIARLRRLQQRLPDHLRYSPAYLEALARIEGRRSDPLTRVITRATFGKWSLVGLPEVE